MNVPHVHNICIHTLPLNVILECPAGTEAGKFTVDCLFCECTISLSDDPSIEDGVYGDNTTSTLGLYAIDATNQTVQVPLTIAAGWPKFAPEMTTCYIYENSPVGTTASCDTMEPISFINEPYYSLDPCK